MCSRAEIRMMVFPVTDQEKTFAVRDENWIEIHGFFINFFLFFVLFVIGPDKLVYMISSQATIYNFLFTFLFGSRTIFFYASLSPDYFLSLFFIS